MKASTAGFFCRTATWNRPLGTVISGEENFNQYFANLGKVDSDNPVYAIHERYAIPAEASERKRENFYDRFDVAKSPNEPLRFGWGLEIDPFEPESTPRERTALGRNKQQGHISVVAPNGQVVTSGRGGSFEEPMTRWPRGGDMPPRLTVVILEKDSSEPLSGTPTA
jgi:secreted PhoX family phosphatase